MNGQFKAGDIVLGNWTLTQKVGEGSFGKVFEAHRQDFGVVYRSAIKIITIPQNKSEITSAKAEGMDDDSVTIYFRSVVENIVQEFALMSRLKGTANIVSYEDHSVVPHEGEIGWDIIIRMEFLKPLINHMAESTMTRRDIITLGIDMCKALELCQKYNIIHRDIKPENIFLSENGDYKLGDFGIARTIEQTSGGLSKKGTYSYMAPEVYREDAYGSTVDIYSLGIVLYRLLNNNRTPFLPDFPAPIKHSDRERALIKRISGEKIGNPAKDNGRLAEIVLKACAYEPKDRYSSPLQMRQELESILLSEKEEKELHNLTEGTIVVGKNSQNREYSEYRVNVDAHSFVGDGDDEKDPEGTVLAQRILAEENKQVEENESRKRTEQEEKHAKKNETSRQPLEKEENKNKSTLHRRKKGVAIFAGVIVLLAVLLFAIVPKPDKWEYDDAGNITKHTEYGAFGVVRTYVEYEYDENGNHTRYFSYEKGELKEVGEYTGDGQTAKRIWYKNGVVDEVAEYEYDADGNITRHISSDASGVVDYISELVYDLDGKIVQNSVTLFDSDGKKLSTEVRNIEEGSTIEYKYDSEGNLINVSTYDKDGALLNSDVDYLSSPAPTTAPAPKLTTTSPETMPTAEIIDFSSNSLFTLLLRADGTVACVPTTGNTFDNRSKVSVLEEIVYVAAGNNFAVGLKSDGTVAVVDDILNPGIDNAEALKVENWKDIVKVNAGHTHTVGLKSDGTVVAVGDNLMGCCEVSEWKDIIAIDAGMMHTVGLKSDGTVVATGGNFAAMLDSMAMCDVADWENIIEIGAGMSHTVGLRSDGTVVANGNNDCGQCNVYNWKDIVAVAAGDQHTVGLKSDGTVVAVGSNDNDQCNVSSWENIVAIGAGFNYTIGIKADGSILVANNYESVKRDFEEFTFKPSIPNISGPVSMTESQIIPYITAVAAGENHIVKLLSDGTVTVLGDNLYGEGDVEDWTGIVAIEAGDFSTFGIKADGSVLSVGYEKYGETDVADWKDIIDIESNSYQTFGIRKNGTVIATGNNVMGALDGIDQWNNIVQTAAGNGHTIGLKKDGDVVATGYNGQGQCDVETWTDIVAVAAGWHHTVGLKSDGTVVATGENSSGECNVAAWTDIVAIAADQTFTVGLRADGTVVTTGPTANFNRNDLSGWSDVVAIDTSLCRSVGLKADGTLISEIWSKMHNAG